ncbi:MAG: TAXI family TRAP transporter solute-binding subunit [Proteobacteria bacterium]|nr:TAXI family TRAP transporter solute-binding subunit [Pseudomonadota bacterium]
MKRGTCMVAVAVVTSFVLFGGVGTSAQAQSAGLIQIGTHPVGAFFNIVGTAVGKVIDARTPMKAKVAPLSGPSAWMPMMVTGEMDLGVCNATDANWGYLGKETYGKISKGKGFPLRLVLTGIYNDISVGVAKDSGIKTLKDLKGKRVAAGFANSPAVQHQFLSALANAGLSIKDVKVIPVSAPPPAMKAVLEGRADASGSVTTGMPVFAELAAKKGALLLSFDPSPEAKARALKAYPHGWLNLVKGGQYPGVDVDTWLLRYEIYVLARADLSDGAVYDIIKAMWDYNSDLPPIHNKFKEWEKENYASKLLLVPYHPGAVKFLEEKGLWTSDLEERQKGLLTGKK